MWKVSLAALAAIISIDSDETSPDTGIVINLKSPKLFPETKDRLSQEQLSQMVEEPISAVIDGHLAKGERDFLRLIEAARGQTLRIADLHTAFGLGLFAEAMDSKEKATRAASLAHLKRAIPYYEEAFGSNHPEVALALTSLADAMEELAKPEWASGRTPLHRQALEIRRAALGVSNPETLASIAGLADSLIDDPFSSDDSKYEALKLYEEGAANAPKNAPSEVSSARFRLGTATVLAATGRIEEAVSTAEDAIASLSEGDGPARCTALLRRTRRFAERMGEAGAADQGEALREKVENACVISFFDVLSQALDTE